MLASSMGAAPGGPSKLSKFAMDHFRTGPYVFCGRVNIFVNGPHFAVSTETISSRGKIARVAPGRYRPGAPTDPYVRTLAHTVPQITGSLLGRKPNEQYVQALADIA